MQNKKTNTKTVILIVVAFVVLIGAALTAYFLTRPETAQGAKTYTITVVHADGSERPFELHTDAEFLGDALLEAKLIQATDGPYGLDVSHVDGERAVWAEDNAYWALYVGQEYATTGVSTTPVYDGSVFQYVWTSADASGF